MGVLLAMLGAVAFSGKAIIVKLAYRHGVDAITLLMLRMLLALPFFLAMAWWTGRPKNGVAALALTRKDWLGLVWLGLTGYYLASFLDFAGLAYISASFERLVLYLNPTLVLILGAVLYRKRISPFQWVGLAISYGGVLLVFGHEVRLTGEHVWLGAGLVFSSAVSYALYLSYSGEMVRRFGALRLAPQVLVLSVVNATACTVVPVVLVMMAIERLGSGLAAQVGMIGPMSTLAMAALFLDEPLTPWVLGGTVLVMGGVFVCTRSQASPVGIEKG